jgi:hypothetical protein
MSKGFKKAYTSKRENATLAIALMPHPLGMGMQDAPHPGERNSTDTRSLEERRPTSTRLRDTIRMMNAKRI